MLPLVRLQNRAMLELLLLQLVAILVVMRLLLPMARMMMMMVVVVKAGAPNWRTVRLVVLRLCVEQRLDQTN